MSQAFGHPAFPVDTHINRLMKQWKLSEGKNVEQVEADAKKLFPKKHMEQASSSDYILRKRVFSRLVVKAKKTF
jgi:endonuclease III